MLVMNNRHGDCGSCEMYSYPLPKVMTVLHYFECCEHPEHLHESPQLQSLPHMMKGWGGRESRSP